MRVVWMTMGCLFAFTVTFTAFSPIFDENNKPCVGSFGANNYTSGFVVLPVVPVGPHAGETIFARVSLLLGQDGLLYDFDGVTKPKELTETMDLFEPIENPSLKLTNLQVKDFKNHLLKSHEWHEDDKKNGRLFRPDCFYDVMGLYEIEFREWCSNKEPQWNKYPPLGALKKTVDGFIELGIGEKPIFGRTALYGSRFRALTVKQLKELVDVGRKNFKCAGAGFFQLIDGYKIKDELGLQEALKLTDIAYLQEDNPGALFQIASTFNALEGGMGNDSTTYGRRLEEMQYTPTQGENAALSTMGATIIRKYCLPRINLVENLVTSKKVIMNKTSGRDGLIWEIKKSLSEGDIDSVEVGIHSDVVVTSGYYGCYSDYLKGRFLKKHSDIKDRIAFLEDRIIVKKDREPFFVYNTRMDLTNPKAFIRVDQLFTAALNIDKFGQRGLDEKNGRVILKAAYQGTMYAAALRAIEKSLAGISCGKQKVFLTLVGAGAFGNEVSWIVDILKEPWFEKIIKDFGLEVYLVMYSSPRSDRTMDTEDLKLLRDLEAQLPKDRSIENLAQALKAIA